MSSSIDSLMPPYGVWLSPCHSPFCWRCQIVFRTLETSPAATFLQAEDGSNTIEALRAAVREAAGNPQVIIYSCCFTERVVASNVALPRLTFHFFPLHFRLHNSYNWDRKYGTVLPQACLNATKGFFVSPTEKCKTLRCTIWSLVVRAVAACLAKRSGSFTLVFHFWHPN